MRHARLASALAAVVALTVTAAFGMPTSFPDVPSAVAAAKARNKTVLVEFFDLDDQASEDVKRDLLGSLAFQAWADPKLYVVVVNVKGRDVPDPRKMTAAEGLRSDFHVGSLPCFVFVDSDGYERGRLYGGGTPEEWIRSAERAMNEPRGSLRIPFVDRERASSGGSGGAGGSCFMVVFFLGIPAAFVFVMLRKRNLAAGGATASSSAKPAVPAKPARSIWDDSTFGDLQVRDLRRRLAAGDWKSVEAKLAAARDPEPREFLVEALAHWPGKASVAGGDVIAAWTAAAPSSPAPHLIQGRWLIEHAWEARGGGVASTVTAKGFTLFGERLHAAEKSLLRAAELDPSDGLPWAYRIAVDLGLPRKIPEARAHFDEAVRRAPECRAAHVWFLAMLCKKWYGDHASMFAFAREAAAKAPAGSNLHALVALAHAERWLYTSMADPKDGDPFRGRAEAYWAQPDVKAEILRAHDQGTAAPGYVEKSPRAAYDRNNFAFCLWQLNESARLKGELERIGTRVVEIPWRWCGEEGFNNARKQMGLPPLPARSGPIV